jgi:fatty-acid desaturase
MENPAIDISAVPSPVAGSADVPRVRRPILWAYAIPIALMHLLACLAFVPWLFTWTGAVVMLIGVHVFGQAINLYYHRMLSHRSFRVPRWLERMFAILALCCLQDTPARWVATHRLHHNHSDEEPDPHTPLVSFFWAHVGWLLVRNPGTHNLAVYHKYARDILSDPFYMRLEKNPWLPFAVYVAHAVLYFAAGWAAGWWWTGQWLPAVQFGASLLVWGVIVRTVVVWHITWSVNSLTHLWGYRNYDTGEGSRNNWLVSLLSVGEGWHNNHHADPASASVQHRWWELDISYWQIRLLERLGLAWDVRQPRHRRRRAAANDCSV